MPFDSIPQFLVDAGHLAVFIQAFEQGTWPLNDWTHTAHVAMAAWYLKNLPREHVATTVRKGIRHYNESVGVPNTPDRGYHETLTLFWLWEIGRFLDSRPKEPVFEAVRSAVNEFGPKRDLFKSYYSFDVVKSREARAAWIAPDRSPGSLHVAGTSFLVEAKHTNR